MVLGGVGDWLIHFRGVDERFLKRVEALWPACMLALPGQPIEDLITINLVDRLGKDAEVRRFCHWVEYQYEPFGIAPDGSRYSKGKIDMALLFDWNRDLYLAYECKRLNVINKAGGRSSLATLYVTEGMNRFLTEQYAQGLSSGGMLGYVMDGDLVAAKGFLDAAITSNIPFPLHSGPDTLPQVGTISRFSTLHDRVGVGDFLLHHALIGR